MTERRLYRDDKDRRADPDVGLRRHAIGPIFRGFGRAYDIFRWGEGPDSRGQAAEIWVKFD